jgi:hypothetical protein
MQKLSSLAAMLVFIGNFVISSVAFTYFLNWYDTGRLSSDGCDFVAIGSIIFGSIALMVEIWIHNRNGLWPKNRLLFFLRFTALSTLYIALSFAVGSGLGYAIFKISKGAGPFTALGILLLSPILAAFYSIMIVPFGVLVGLVNGLMLRLNFIHPKEFRHR